MAKAEVKKGRSRKREMRWTRT